jgi:hypothetical protein
MMMMMMMMMMAPAPHWLRPLGMDEFMPKPIRKKVEKLSLLLASHPLVVQAGAADEARDWRCRRSSP